MSNSETILIILGIIAVFIITKIYDCRDMPIGDLLLSLLFDNPKKDYPSETDFSNTLKNIKNLLEPEAKTDYIDYSNIRFIKEDFTYNIDIDNIREPTTINLKIKLSKILFFHSRITSKVTNRTKIHFENIPLQAQKPFETGDPKFDHYFQCLTENNSEIVFFLDKEIRNKLIQCNSKSGGISFFEDTILIRNKFSSKTNYKNLKDTVDIIKDVVLQYSKKLSNEKESLISNLKKEKIPAIVKSNLELINEKYKNEPEVMDLLKIIYNKKNIELKVIAAKFMNISYTEKLITLIPENFNFEDSVINDILKLACQKNINPEIELLKKIFSKFEDLNIHKSVLKLMKKTDQYTAFINNNIAGSSYNIMNFMIEELKMYGNIESIKMLKDIYQNNKLSFDQKNAIKKTISIIKKSGDLKLKRAISISSNNELDGALSENSNFKGNLSKD